MKIETLFILILSLIASAPTINAQEADTSIDHKITEQAQKELKKNLSQAKFFSTDAQKTDFAKARQEIAAAMANETFEANKAEVLNEAGSVEYNCYNIERNKPAKGKKTDIEVIYNSAEKGFRYLSEAYDLYNSEGGKANKKIKSAIQKKAWTLFTVTEGFRSIAAYAYEKKNWQKAHDCFQLFCDALNSAVINDYAASNSKIDDVFKLYRNDSIRYHALYFRTICTLNQKDNAKAIKELEEIKYNKFEQNAVLQELVNQYRMAGNETKVELVLLEGIEQLPEEPWYIRNLVNKYLEIKDYDLAEEVIDRLLTIDSNNAAALSLKGQISELMGKIDVAQDSYEKSYAIDSINNEINSNLGRLWYNKGSKIEKELHDQLKFNESETESLPAYIKSAEYYWKAFLLDKEHSDKTIPQALRNVYYKQFSKAGCPNRDELIDKYNEVSRAYGLTEFPK